MDVAEFYQWVRDTANRGTTLDTSIPHYIKAAVREIETKNNFQPMAYWAEFPLKTTDEPIISLPDRLKEIGFLRYNTADAGKRPKWEYLTKTSPRETISRVGPPKRYWLKGKQLAVFDAKLDEDYTFELLAYRYTSFPDESSGTGVSHWLVDAIPTGLHAKVMLGLSPFIREQSSLSVQLWEKLYTEAVSELIRENEFSKEADGPAEMIFWPDHIPLSQGFRDTE